ncbi:HEPN domain-containing protein [Sulfurimonas sp.]
MRSFTEEWLKAANDDLMTIEKIKDDLHLSHIVAFHAQQAIEKSFKAFLEESELEIVKTHKLQKLYDNYFIDFVDCDENILAQLDELYIESRYPGDMGLLPNGKPTLENAQEFYDVAENIFLLICEKVKYDPVNIRV